MVCNFIDVLNKPNTLYVTLNNGEFLNSVIIRLYKGEIFQIMIRTLFWSFSFDNVMKSHHMNIMLLLYLY